MEIMKPIKGFIGMTVGTILGGEAMSAVGRIGSGMSAGMKGATQSLIGVGVLGHAAGTTKKIFRLK